MPVLKGAALAARARELNIPGRSKMSADELRAAIAAVSAPVPPSGDPDGWHGLLNPDPEVYGVQPTAQDATEVLDAIFGPAALVTRSDQVKIITVKAAPFRMRNGKRKPSIRHNRTR